MWLKRNSLDSFLKGDMESFVFSGRVVCSEEETWSCLTPQTAVRTKWDSHRDRPGHRAWGRGVLPYLGPSFQTPVVQYLDPRNLVQEFWGQRILFYLCLPPFHLCFLCVVTRPLAFSLLGSHVTQPGFWLSSIAKLTLNLWFALFLYPKC